MQDFNVSISETNYIGMNNKYPSHLLPNGMFTSISNAYIDNNKIFKRGGTSAIATSLGAFRLAGGIGYEPSGSAKRIIVCRDGASNAQLYVYTGSAFSSIGSANLTNNLIMNFMVASNRLFGFDGTEVVDVTTASVVTKNRAGVPIGQFSFWFHNYLFVAGVTGQSSRLYWSNLGDPTTFGVGNFVDINANDGDAITALNILNDELVVFKNDSVWAISGWSGDTFSVTTAAGQNTTNKAAGVGTPSNQSVVSVGRDLYYLSFLGNIPHIRSLNQTSFAKTVEGGIVSDELENTMLTLNREQLINVAGWFDGKYLYWALPVGASETNDLIITLAPGRTFKTTLGNMTSWVIFDGINSGQFFTSTISGRARTYFIDANTTGKVFLFNDTSTFTDDGIPVVMDVRTRDYMGNPSRQTKYKYYYHKYQSGFPGELNVYARVDQAQDYILQDTIDLNGNSPGLGPTGTFTLGVSVLGGAMVTQDRVTLQHLTGTLLGMRYLESTENYCELYDHQIYGFLKGFRNA